MDTSIFALADAFLSIDSMTHLKLQKLCYYAKAWYLALYDENIITEQFEAWVHGAVNPELYQKYKRYGFIPIPKTEINPEVPEDFYEFSEAVYETYGKFSAYELELLNHREYPWIHARGDRNPWESCNVIITEDDMKSYYRSKMEEAKNK